LALLVDAIDGTRELVVKPLAPLLAGHPFGSGTSLSVTGEVILMLNASGLARWLRDGQSRTRPAPDQAARSASAPVLVVDDSISVRTVAARQFRAMGYEVEEVSDGLEALGKLRSRNYSMVLSDLEMPRMDGFELLAELSRLEISPAIPVIIASTRSDPATSRRVLELGARAFLAKPIDSELLAGQVRELLPINDGRRPTVTNHRGGIGEEDLSRCGESPCRKIR
jgi:CheY-like chemotaxis protein